jgi:hypothetical protein
MICHSKKTKIMITGREAYHPKEHYGGTLKLDNDPGVTIREQFAAMAMQSFIAGSYYNPEILRAMQEGAKSVFKSLGEHIVSESVQMADLLIIELNK